MKPLNSKLILMLLLLFLSPSAFGKISKSTVYFPDDLTIGGGVNILRSLFYHTTDFNQQIIITKMIARNTQPERFDVLQEIATWDIKQANKYGQSFNTAPEAKLIAVENLAKSGNPKYLDSYISILKYDSNLDIAIAAAKAIPEMKDPKISEVLINLIRYDYNYSNFKEDDDKMYRDDRVVEAIVNTLGEIGDPKAFTALLQIVVQQNHRQATIKAAWAAIDKLKW